MITTQTVTVDQPTLFKILRGLAFPRRSRFLFAVAALLAIAYLVILPPNALLYILLGAVVLFPLLLLFQARRAARNSMNSEVALSRHYTIGDGEMTAHLQNGEQEVFNIVHLQKIIRYPKYYLLFTSPVEFLYLPYEAFGSETDRNRFEKEVVSRARTVKKG